MLIRLLVLVAIIGFALSPIAIGVCMELLGMSTGEHVNGVYLWPIITIPISGLMLLAWIAWQVISLCIWLQSK